MEDYKNLTTLDVATIVAVHEALTGSRSYLDNIISDVKHDYKLDDEEAALFKNSVIEEVLDVTDFGNEFLLTCYENTLIDVAYTKINIDNKEIYFERESLRNVLHAEIIRRMK